MANVDKNLYNAPATNGSVADKATEFPKRGIKGAAGGSYVGPIIGKASHIVLGPTSPTHATGAAAGGVEDSTGYRESDTYGVDGANSGGTGGADTAQTRPTGRTAYGGAGAFFAQVVTITGSIDAGDEFKLSYRGADSATFTAGTDMASSDLQTSLRSLMKDPFLTVSGTTDTGPFIIKHSKPVGAGLTITQVTDTGSDETFAISLPKGSKESTAKGDGGFALGSSARGTFVTSETVTNPVGITRPLVGTAAAPAEGTVGVITGTAKFTIDMHANDVTNYGGAEVLVFARGNPNTDADGDFIGAITFDSATEGDGLTTANVPALVVGTYAVYVRFIGNDGNVGPLSARGTVAIS